MEALSTRGRTVSTPACERTHIHACSTIQHWWPPIDITWLRKVSEVVGTKQSLQCLKIYTLSSVSKTWSEILRTIQTMSPRAEPSLSRHFWLSVRPHSESLRAVLWRNKSTNASLGTRWYCDGATLCSLLELNRSKVCENHAHESFLKHLCHPLARFRSLSLTTVSNALPYACLWAFVIPSRHHESCEQISIWRFLEQSICNAYRHVTD